MRKVHLLNVDPGACTIIEHGSSRVTMIDICDGNIPTEAYSPSRLAVRRGHTGNFRMGLCCTNPIDYLQALGIKRLFRFILTHPDMDHMDGIDALRDAMPIVNYWDTGSRRERPPFGAGSRYREADWERYVRLRDGRDGAKAIQKLAGDQFEFANSDDGDGLHILAPNTDLVRDCNMYDDINDGSYALLYRAGHNRIVLPGDAHDNTWAYIRGRWAGHVANASFLLAPHHGRDSARSYDFLDLVRPALTLIGNSPCEHIDYSQWTRRGLEYITSDQCGNVVLQADTGPFGDFLAVFVQNVDFAVARGEGTFTNAQGYAFLTTITARPERATQPAA